MDEVYTQPSLSDTTDCCPKCGRPYGKRKRCYFCHWKDRGNTDGRPRTGQYRRCPQCGKEFYAAAWQTRSGQGKFCSVACKVESQRIPGSGYEYKRTDGYIAVYYPSHPDAPVSGWMLKHRLIAEEKIGRRLLRTEHVHHLSGVKDDNRPENLEVVEAGDHARITSKRAVAKRLTEREELEEYRRRYGPLK